ncbi:MAG: hypothetical protein AAF125_12155 [Chloroflexota bacterium]
MTTLIEMKQMILQERKARTSIEALRSMAAMQTRPIPFLTTVGAAVALVGQIRYQPPSDESQIPRYDPVATAKRYAEAGVDAVAMFTDNNPTYDSAVDATLVNEAMQFHRTPFICQDYMLDEYHVVAARATGASVVVLTSGIVPPDALRLLTSATQRNRMTAVVDVFDETQLEAALAWSPQVIGLSNNDPLSTEINLDTVRRLRALVPKGVRVMISHPVNDMDMVHEIADVGVDAVMMDEGLLHSEASVGMVREALLKAN